MATAQTTQVKSKSLTKIATPPGDLVATTLENSRMAHLKQHTAVSMQTERQTDASVPWRQQLTNNLVHHFVWATQSLPGTWGAHKCTSTPGPVQAC